MKALFTIAKIIPRLDSENEGEKTAAFRLIEAKLRNEGIKWVDVGLRLTEFLTEVAGFEEPEKIEAAAEKEKEKANGWTTTGAAPAPSTQNSAPPGWQSMGGTAGQYTPHPARQTYSPPPPRPKQPDPRCDQGPTQQLAVVRELLALSHPWTQKERQSLLAIEQLLDSGLPIGRKQLTQLKEWSKKL